MPVTDSYSDSIEQREDDRCWFLNTKYSNKRPLQRVKGSKVRGRILQAYSTKSGPQEQHQIEPQIILWW